MNKHGKQNRQSTSENLVQDRISTVRTMKRVTSIPPERAMDRTQKRRVGERRAITESQEDALETLPPSSWGGREAASGSSSMSSLSDAAETLRPAKQETTSPPTSGRGRPISGSAYRFRREDATTDATDDDAPPLSSEILGRTIRPKSQSVKSSK
jgi:hypothetical protein